MKKQHWNTLVASIRHGQCILVLGPEIPMDTVGTPSDADDISFAEALTRELAADLEEDGLRVSRTTLAAVAQQYEDAPEYGPHALRARAENFYKSPQFVHSETHVALANLPFSLILTTCHDDLMADALQAIDKSPIIERYQFRGTTRDNPEPQLPSSPQAPLIYHLFGDAQAPGSLVLSENDLLDFLINVVSDRPPLPNSLVRALKRNNQSFLFVGFGITQWYLRVLLKVLVRSLELNRTSSSIAAEPLRGLSEADREQTILFYQRGTRIELEDADTRKFLTELKQLVDAEGGVTEQSTPPGPYIRVFISYASEDRDLAGMTSSALRKAGFEPWLDTSELRGGEHWDESIGDAIEDADFTLVLYSRALCQKTDSYVNKEIDLARERGRKVRGPFLIPLKTADIAAENRITELKKYQTMPLRLTHFDEDIANVIKTMRREFQLRDR